MSTPTNTAFDEFSRIISPCNLTQCMAVEIPGTNQPYINLHVYTGSAPSDMDVCQCGKFFYSAAKGIAGP